MSTTFLLAALLVAHGLVHLAIWLPHPAQDPANPPPLDPHHSDLLAALAVPRAPMRHLAEALAIATAATFVLAGVAVGFGAAEAVPLAVAAATFGLLLKAPYFHTWLALGVTLDLLVLAVALSDWPVPLV